MGGGLREQVIILDHHLDHSKNRKRLVFFISLLLVVYRLRKIQWNELLQTVFDTYRATTSILLIKYSK